MVILIECIMRVNEGENPILLLGVLLPQEPRRMYPPLNPRLQATTEQFRTAGLLGLRPCHHQHTLLQNPTPSIPHAYCTDPRSLVEVNEAS